MAGKYRGRAVAKHGASQTSRFFETVISSSQSFLIHGGQVWRPPTDVYETDDSIVVKVEVAGMAEDDFAIAFSDLTLIVAGIRRDPSAKLGYHQMEIPYGEFRTQVHVPETVDVDGIEASYQDGFLLVVLPKVQPRRVTITKE